MLCLLVPSKRSFLFLFESSLQSRTFTLIPNMSLFSQQRKKHTQCIQNTETEQKREQCFSYVHYSIVWYLNQREPGLMKIQLIFWVWCTAHIIQILIAANIRIFRFTFGVLLQYDPSYNVNDNIIGASWDERTTVSRHSLIMHASYCFANGFLSRSLSSFPN